MGNFQQHITCSTVTGIAVGGIAYHFGFSPQVCLVSAGLCSFAGMLPDIDSVTSKSFQECIYLTAGVGCVLTTPRLRHFGIDQDLAMLGGALVFLLIRFGLAPIIKNVTVHRGMIHSIPMAILCGEFVFFVVTGQAIERLVKSVALTIGFLSHLILDEVYSIDSTGAALRLKKSFGTALKWTNPQKQGSVTLIYSLIVLLGLVACSNPEVIEQLNDSVAVTENRTPDQTPLGWWFSVSKNAKNKQQSLDNEIRSDAEQFLSQQGTVPSVAVQIHNVPVAPPTAIELPTAMQIGNEWDRNTSIQPARIVLQ